MVPFWEQGTLTSVSDVQSGQRALLVEAKSGETVSSDAFDSLDKVQAVLETGSHQLKASKMVVHGGSDRWIHRKTTLYLGATLTATIGRKGRTMGDNMLHTGPSSTSKPASPGPMCRRPLAKALAKLFQSRTEGDDVDISETVSLVAAVKQQAARLRVVGTEQSQGGDVVLAKTGGSLDLDGMQATFAV